MGGQQQRRKGLVVSMAGDRAQVRFIDLLIWWMDGLLGRTKPLLATPTSYIRICILHTVARMMVPSNPPSLPPCIIHIQKKLGGAAERPGQHPGRQEFRAGRSGAGGPQSPERGVLLPGYALGLSW